MKKAEIVNLIRAHFDKDESSFRKAVGRIATEFYSLGDRELAEYLSGLLSDDLSFVPQSSSTISSPYLIRDNAGAGSLFWPDAIFQDVNGIFNALSKDSGVSKFLFYGPSGTGKTETARVLARKLNRELWIVHVSNLVDFKLGETAKHIDELFNCIGRCQDPRHHFFLFDEIDSIALNRISNLDVREMGRATTAFLKGLETLSDQIAVIATTNLFPDLDQALIRRFDSAIDFGRYSYEDLISIAKKIYVQSTKKVETKSDVRLFEKVLRLSPSAMYPGSMKNLIKTSLAFSASDNPYEHLLRIAEKMGVIPAKNPESFLADHGFSLREIGMLTRTSASTVFRRLNANE